MFDVVSYKAARLAELSCLIPRDIRLVVEFIYTVIMIVMIITVIVRLPSDNIDSARCPLLARLLNFGGDSKLTFLLFFRR